MIVLGLTGSIGMGKSTLGAMLTELGVPVDEADAHVHTLLAPGGQAVPEVAQAFPYPLYPYIYGPKNKAGIKPIDRKALGKLVFEDDEKREILERILHPLVRAKQDEFIAAQKRLGAKMVALDIPLLFETGREARVDYTLVVSAPAFIQEERVLARPGMDRAKFEAILARQMSDAQKRTRADFVINTGLNRAETMRELKTVLAQIKDKNE